MNLFLVPLLCTIPYEFGTEKEESHRWKITCVKWPQNQFSVDLTYQIFILKLIIRVLHYLIYKLCGKKKKKSLRAYIGPHSTLKLLLKGDDVIMLAMKFLSCLLWPLVNSNETQALRGKSKLNSNMEPLHHVFHSKSTGNSLHSDFLLLRKHVSGEVEKFKSESANHT